VLTLRAAQHKLTEPMVASQMRLPQRFVERLARSAPLHTQRKRPQEAHPEAGV
jgi:hypothetical protein